MKFDYYLEVIRMYEELLDQGNTEYDAAYTLATVFPIETNLLLSQGYFSILDN